MDNGQHPSALHQGQSQIHLCSALVENSYFKKKKKKIIIKNFFFCAHEEDLKDSKAEPMEIHKLVRYAKEMVESEVQKGVRLPSLCFLLVSGRWVPAQSDHLESGKPQPTQEWDAVQAKRESNHPEVGVSAKGK